MPWKLLCRNKKQDKKILRLKLFGKIRNAKLKLEPNVLIKKRVPRLRCLKKRLQKARTDDDMFIFSLMN